MRGSGRSRSIAAGTIAPLALGMIAALVFFGIAASRTPWRQEAGVPGILFTLFPGVFTLGLLVALPTASAHVCSMSWLSKRYPASDSLAAWTIAGALFSSPAGVLFTVLDRGAPPIGMGFAWLLGLIGGCAAGLYRPTNNR